MAAPKSRHRARKRRGNPGAAPRAVSSPRREQRAERETQAARKQRAAASPIGTYGERPQSPFGGLPISELAIFAGAIALVVGLVQGGGAALIVGFVVCALGVLEVSAREHLSGYRSHSALLAAIPTVGLELALVGAIGGAQRQRPLLLAAVVPVFALLFWLLRQRFRVARQRRLARPPGA